MLNPNSRIGEKVGRGRLGGGRALLSIETHRENGEAIREGSYGRFLYNWFRYFDPEAGRYIAGDPAGQSNEVNPYAYARTNPLRYYDPTGGAALPVAGPVPIPIPVSIPAPPPVVLVLGAGAAGYALGTLIEPHVTPWLQSKFGDSCDEIDCEQRYEEDSSVCRAIGRRPGKRAKQRAALCWASAMNRYAACKRGDPPGTWPPLITWNN